MASLLTHCPLWDLHNSYRDLPEILIPKMKTSVFDETPENHHSTTACFWKRKLFTNDLQLWGPKDKKHMICMIPNGAQSLVLVYVKRQRISETEILCRQRFWYAGEMCWLLFGTYLSVTLFLILCPRSEYPWCIGLCGWGSVKLLDVGVLGSENCLSTRIGFGLKTAAEARGGLAADCEADTVMMWGLWRVVLGEGVTPAVVTTAVAPPVKRRDESAEWWRGMARRRFLSSI